MQVGMDVQNATQLIRTTYGISIEHVQTWNLAVGALL